MEKINQVSIRLVNERPLLSEEQLTSPEKVAMVVGDYIRDLDREALCVINFNSKLQPIFTIESRKFFAFGGASSHDISDGILCPDNWKEKAKELERQGKYGFRVKDISWWKEELPTEEEMKHGMDVLKINNNIVDYIISHSPSTSELYLIGGVGLYETDVLTNYLEEIKATTNYKKHFFGHMHVDQAINSESICLYEQIIRII